MGVMGTLLGGRRPSSSTNSSVSANGAGADTTGSNSNSERQPPSPESDSNSSAPNAAAAMAAVSLGGDVDRPDEYSEGKIGFSGTAHLEQEAAASSISSTTTSNRPIRPQPGHHNHHHHHRSYRSRVSRQQHLQQQGAFDRDEIMVGEPMSCEEDDSRPAPQSTPTRQRLPAAAPVVPVMARNGSGSAAAVSQHQSSQQSQQMKTQTSHISPAAQNNTIANGVDGQAYASASPSAQAAQVSSAINTAATSAAAALAALPPPGLSGPASFRFSPACPALDGPSYAPFDPESKEGSLGGRYLSFLSASGGGGTSSSSSDMMAKMIASQPRNVNPPLKSAMASSNKAQQQQQQRAMSAAGSAATATERKLCVIDLEPFTRQLRREEEEYYASRYGFKIDKGRSETQEFVESSKAADRDYYCDDDDHMEEDNEDAERAARQGEVVVDFAKQGEVVVDFAKQRPIEGGSGSEAGCASTPTPLLPISDPRIILQQYAEPLLNLTLSAPVMPPCRPLSPEKLGMRNSFDTSGQRNSSSSNKTMHERPTLATEHAHRHKRREHSACRSAAAMSLQEGGSDHSLSLAERLRRERQRLHSSGVTQFGWSRRVDDHDEETVRIVVPHRGNIYVQDGIGADAEGGLRILYDKSTLQKAAEEKNSRRRRRDSEEYAAAAAAHAKDFGAIDPQLSPDGTMVAFVVAGEIYVLGCEADQTSSTYCSRIKEEGGTSKMDIDISITSAGNSDEIFSPMIPLRITFGAVVGEDDEEEEDDNRFSSDEFEDDDYISDTGTDELSDTEIYNVGVGESLGQASRMQRHTKSRRRRQVPHGKEKRRYPRSITHGLADFVAQEEMDRYRGFWWDPSSSGIVFARVDESDIPPFRITHQGKEGGASSDAPYEDHRYPFAGEANPVVRLGYVKVDRSYVPGSESRPVPHYGPSMDDDYMSGDGSSGMFSRQLLAKARANWNATKWFDPPSLASEYLARVNWLPDGTVCAQWQDRGQALLLLVRLDLITGKSSILHKEYSDVWINLHHMMRVLPRAIHPDEVGGEIAESKRRNIPKQLPEGSFSFLFASERTGYSHLYLYTHVAGTEKYISTTDGDNSDDEKGVFEPEIDTSAILLRAVSSGPWIVESIVGVDVTNDVVYITGTYDSPLQRHLYALPLLGRVARQQDKASETEPSGVGRWRKHVPFRRSRSDGLVLSTEEIMSPAEEKANAAFKLAGIPGPKPPDPIKFTSGSGMHSVVMDKACRLVVDTCSDLDTPTQICVYALPVGGPFASSSETEIESGKKSKDDSVMQSSDHPSQLQAMRLLFVCYEAKADDKTQLIPTKLASIVNRGGLGMSGLYPSLSAPEILSFPTADGTETLYAALYKPDPMLFGPGPYPLVCAVYGGPHVQRVNQSWSQSADMRAQHLRSLGFAVVKCDNRGSSRRGVAFEGAIRKRLGRLEVLDQVSAVRHLVQLGIADATRVGIYGWSYGGYLSTMCLVRAPDVFHVAVAGAPVTSWDGYDTHYTERYMGQPSENESGYNESAVFDHVPNMRGRLMIVHGLIDENVHFRHTARLINRLIAAGKDYELLIFPDERHSPRRLRDRVYMEKRISDYLVKNLLRSPVGGSGADGMVRVGVGGLAGLGASGGVAPKL